MSLLQINTENLLIMVFTILGGIVHLSRTVWICFNDKERHNAGFNMPGFLCSFPNCHLSSHLCGLGLVKWRNGRDGGSYGRGSWGDENEGLHKEEAALDGNWLRLVPKGYSSGCDFDTAPPAKR